jgi:uncharacterized membrane protein HdeD (DUF308 family)
MSRQPPPSTDRLASTIREGGSWVAVGPSAPAPKKAPDWAATLSLVLGLVAIAIGGVLFTFPPIFFFYLLALSGLIAIGGLILARVARGSHPRNARERWPGRGMALAGALLSWSVLAVLLVLAFIIVIVIANGGLDIGPNNLP